MTHTLPPDPFWSLVPTHEKVVRPETEFSEEVTELSQNHICYKLDMETHPKKWWSQLFVSILSLVLFAIASVQEWTEIKVAQPGQQPLRIRTYLFGYQCTEDQQGFVSCDDGLKFSGTKTRMDYMQSVFSFYFIACVLLLWGIYEHLRDRMAPWYRTLWFGL